MGDPEGPRASSQPVEGAGQPSRRATLADIAHSVGVSEATVSRALRDDPQIGRRTRATVRLVAAELDYVPNHAARSLARSATQTLGLMVPDVVDAVHGLVVRGFERVAEASGFAVIIVSGFLDEQQEARGFGVFRSHQVDAVALCGTATAIPGAASALGPVPVMFIGPEGIGASVTQDPGPRAGVLMPDDEEGMAQLVAHLLATGRSRLSYLNGHAMRSNEARRRATATALESAGHEPRVREFPAIRTWRDCDRIVALVAREQPDAIVCYDDDSALHLLAALRAGGLRVPQDVAVTGFDDIPFAEIANPALTTVAQPVEEMGARAAVALLASIGSGTALASERIPLALRARESTAVASST